MTNPGRFDYSQVQGVPEVLVRTELLRERLNLRVGSHQSRILEVGIGSGDVTLMLVTFCRELICIEPDGETCLRVRNRLRELKQTSVKFLNAKVEEAPLEPGGYDHIILLGVLEHLSDPVFALKRLAGLLNSKGIMHVTVNLAGSLHRWLGVKMGLIDSVESLGESDLHLGHYRVYTRGILKDHLNRGGLKVDYELPFYLKPLPTTFLNPLSMDIHKGFFKLGQMFPELASYLYVEAKG